MNITFKALQTDHLSLLLCWLEKPHVKAWWDPDIQWTMELVREKYGSYVEGYKLEGGIEKPMAAYIACVDEVPVAYIQLYNAHDYPREDGASLDDLPESLAAIDIFIGAETYVGKGYGSSIIRRFQEEVVDPKFEACFVDPDKDNVQAIRAYEKAGFRSVETHGNSIWMIRTRK